MGTRPLIQKIFGMEIWIDESLKGNEFELRSDDGN